MKKMVMAAALALPLVGFNANADDSMPMQTLDSLSAVQLSDQELDVWEQEFGGLEANDEDN